MAEKTPKDLLYHKHEQQREELQAKIEILKESSIFKSDEKTKKEINENIRRLQHELDLHPAIEMLNFDCERLLKEKTDILTETIILPENDTNPQNNISTSSVISKEKTEDISRLDHELDVQHATEKLNFDGERLIKEKTDICTETIRLPEKDSNPQNNISTPPQRISRAQKRRDKKAAAERERNERIVEQEALNVFGKRSVETQTIKKILGEHQLMIYEIPSDGHCLYNAVAHQLKAIGEMPLSLKELRQKTAVYLRENMNDFLPFISNDTDELLSPEQYEKYCDNVESTSAWGGDVELQVLSKILQCPIEIIQATGKPYVIGLEFSKGKKIILTFHRHLYELGAHYNSVTKFINEEDN